MFPSNFTRERGTDRKDSLNINIELFGDRILSDQTLSEYLIEFLQVFTSAKDVDGSGKLCFHGFDLVDKGNLKFYVDLRVALRRFIFYGRSKQEGRSEMDTWAYERMEALLKKEAQSNEEDIDLIHDLLLNYAIVTRNRGWYAQALMPVAPEMILAELQGIKKRQKKKISGEEPLDGKPEKDKSDEAWFADIDGMFDWSKHNYLSRGGQVLYLHMLQGILKHGDAATAVKERMEKLLVNMLTCSSDGIGLLADFVQREWQTDITKEHECDKAYQLKQFNMSFIANEFELRSKRFVDEVMTFLSANIHPIARIELLSQGIVVSLLRSMHLIAAQRIGMVNGEPAWIMDVSQLGGTSNIAKLSAQSYASAYDSFQAALLRVYDELSDQKSKRFQTVQRAKKDSADVFKRLGKELKLIIPPRGAYERFSLSESLVRYFVLALIKPGCKMIYDTFLERLYEHFGIVIAPQTYREALRTGVLTGSEDMVDYFKINAETFQRFLKQCGFLRDLSDATAIVENPYSPVEI